MAGSRWSRITGSSVAFAGCSIVYLDSASSAG